MTITYLCKGHHFENEVQTIIQVFYPNLHYTPVAEISKDAMTVKSIWENNIAIAEIYQHAVLVQTSSFACTLIEEKEIKHAIKAVLYQALCQLTNITPPWGMMTGIRPAKVVNEQLNKKNTPEQAVQYLKDHYQVSEQKARLALEVAQAERNILSSALPNQASLYIGIPFCPTRCLYCSFTSYPLAQYQQKVDSYLDALLKELSYLAEYAKNYHLDTIYIGGGTPTSLGEDQLERLLQAVEEMFDLKKIREYTVEAGRPDTITPEKLRIMKNYQVSRISINPQTMNQKTLDLIGRKHSVEHIVTVFHEARQAGHQNINMDLILGLPKETPQDVANTMEKIVSLNPESITIHTLAVKRASRLKENLSSYELYSSDLEKMLAIAAKGALKMGMKPYYMYRQKNMVGNFENVGYCKKGFEGIYNIQIMEERQTILAAGAGASTKTVNWDTNQIDRIFNVKDVDQYIARIDEMIDRKRKGL